MQVVLWIAINTTKKKMLVQALLRLSVTEPQTGIYNKRYVSVNIAYEFSKLKRCAEF